MNKVILAIMDGVGLREQVHGNAFKQAKKPTFDYLWNTYPHTTLIASGKDVGLPPGQMGNSETGHLNIGAGRIVYQPLELINEKIDSGEFYKNKEILKLFDTIKNNKSRLQLVGLISDGGVHSHINHLKSLLKMAKDNGIDEIYMHLITDGRDTLYNSGVNYLKEIKDFGIGKVSTICGRYYTMDRDKNYDRTIKGYDLMVNGVGNNYNSIDELFNNTYKSEIYDEFIKPSLLDKEGLIKENDGIIWFNFRPDRAIQILTKLQEYNSNIVTMMKVSNEIKAPNAFNLQKLDNTLGDYLSKNNLRQLRIAETEKYAHVTYFFDGGVNKEIPLCDRILIPSPKVATYDLKPEMSIEEITSKLLSVMSNYDVIILNFANPDMVGHTGNMSATIKAVEALDKKLKQIYDESVKLGFTLLVTADHGNAELMIDDDGNIITSHTTSKVPFIVCRNGVRLKEGRLSDIAPTMLELIGLSKPKEMAGNSLIIK